MGDYMVISGWILGRFWFFLGCVDEVHWGDSAQKNEQKSVIRGVMPDQSRITEKSGIRTRIR